MVSGVSFSNPANTKATKKKRSIASAGLVFIFLILLIVIAMYGGLYAYKKSLEKQSAFIESEIIQAQTDIDAAVESVSLVMQKKSQLEKHAFSDTSSDDVLTIFQSMMVPAIVFQTFEHGYSERAEAYHVNLTADADTYDILAAQVQAWKESPYFSTVSLGESTRNDEGRILFTAEFNLIPAKSLAEKDITIPVVAASPTAVGVGVPTTQEQAPVEIVGQETQADAVVAPQEDQPSSGQEQEQI